MWSVHDLDLESMINFSTRVTRFDQTKYKHKVYIRRFIYPIYGSDRTLLLLQRRGIVIHFTFEIKFSNDKTSRLRFSLFYYIIFLNNLSNHGVPKISFQQ
jgi:hypothetical protein